MRKLPHEVQDCSPVDLLRLGEKLNRRWHEHSKDDWYAAQQAYETFAIPFRVWGKKVPPQFTVKSFLMKFSDPETRTQVTDEFSAEADRRANEAWVATQKAWWLMGLGLDPETGKPVDDGIPVQTRLPPDMDGMSGISPPNGHPGAVPGVPQPQPAGPRDRTGWTPKGRGKRKR